ncbi:MAG: NAD-dependent succinate-semialdehyde dehydrogenase [Pseudomonadales bacterium]|nr:NAD-dependent succinate-semialdehyde dehydrogenase [Pseudomonadales bacterium]
MGIALKNQDLLKSTGFYAGQWQAAASGKEFPVLNPASGELIVKVSDYGVDDADQAIRSARQAFPAWRALTAKERSQLLMAWYQLILDNSEDLALLITTEQGKPLTEARGEVAYAASFIQWFAEEAKRVYGDTIPSPWADSRIMVLRQPVGVVATITPWNFPAAMITRKAAPALAAGCPCVCKPAEETPLTALALAVLARAAGIPDGVFNIVPSSQSQAVGEVLSTHPQVAMISFTGSTRVGKILLQQASGTVKKVAMELGGNAPFIVFDDADLDAAIEGLMASKFRNNGQTCVCANRILVQEGIYDAFSERLIAAVDKLRVGQGQDEATSLGPMINQAGHRKVSTLVSSALAGGAKSAYTGSLNAQDPARFYPPTVLTDVEAGMAICTEEIFGPVAALQKFSTEEQAIAIANDTTMGLAAYFYARDINRIWRVQEALEYGIVGVNKGLISTEVAPFGGVKESGLGREGSKYGLDEFLEMKYVLQGGLTSA